MPYNTPPSSHNTPSHNHPLPSLEQVGLNHHALQYSSTHPLKSILTTLSSNAPINTLTFLPTTSLSPIDHQRHRSLAMFLRDLFSVVAPSQIAAMVGVYFTALHNPALLHRSHSKVTRLAPYSPPLPSPFIYPSSSTNDRLPAPQPQQGDLPPTHSL